MGLMLHAALNEHAVDVHVPGDADVGSQCVGFAGGVILIAVGDKAMQADIGAEGGFVFESDAVGGVACTGGYQTVERIGGLEVNVGLVLLVGAFDEDVDIVGDEEVEAADDSEVLAPVVSGESMVDKVEINIPAVIDNLVTQCDVVHESFIGTLEHVG